jgi:drug/metabolite transporter (DMT)-like permease
VLAAWLFKERFNAGVALGLALAVSGAVIVLSKGNLAGLVSGGFGIGEWLLLGCIASWTSYTLIGRALMTGIDSLAATTVSMIVGTVLLWAVALTVEGPASMVQTARTLTPLVWWVLVLMSLGATVLAYAWFNRGIAVLGAGTAVGYINLVPIFGVGLSALTLGERVDASLAIGSLLTVAGLVVSQRARRG